MNTPLSHSLQYHQQFVDVSCFSSNILSILNPLREIISDNFMLILEFRNILLITVGMWAADFSNFQFFWPQNIFMDFTSQVQSVFNSLNCFPFLSFGKRHNQNNTNNTDQPNNHELPSHARFLYGAPGIGRIGHDVSNPRYVEDFLPQWRNILWRAVWLHLAKVSWSQSANNVTLAFRWVQHSSGEQHRR